MLKRGHWQWVMTNKEFARKHGVHPRQVSKARRRDGFVITAEGKRVRVPPRARQKPPVRRCQVEVDGESYLLRNWRWFNPPVPLSLSGRVLPHDKVGNALR